MAKIKRSEIKSFMNVGTAETPDYALIGDGVTTGTIAMNPKTTEEQYIHQNNASFSVDGYAPNMPVDQTAIVGDEVFDFVDGLRIDRATYSNAETDIVNVWLYKTPTGGAYPAEKQNVTIAVDNFGGDAGSATKVNYTIYYRGDPIKGTFNPTTLAFTPA